ncbi:MAG: hypothetical protein CVU56_03410 [Deltaproteobacteria bacterium HGW-Deltaproteobacteria-14]|nr:MAG: hypothetical protein CVU56_03410 [Deltaproteobacteria bacterium HGW-Deltaproteobacteria-14]
MIIGALWFGGACGSDAPAIDAAVWDGADEGLITKPDTEGPHCLDVDDLDGEVEDADAPDTAVVDAGPDDTAVADTAVVDSGTADAGPDDTAAADTEGDAADTAVADTEGDAADTAVADTAGDGCAGAADGTPCEDGDPCTAPDRCASGLCVGGRQNPCACPAGMVVAAGVCVDQFEASRPDATASWSGADGAQATSREGVLPWYPVERAAALAACQAAGKRLCTAGEIGAACAGPEGHVYPYGDAYVADACNSIDTFCRCDVGTCASVDPCPYPHCFDHSPSGGAGGCGALPGVRPTGSFPDCVNAYGAYDLSGNVWELVDVGTTASWYRGGAYNCIDSEALHRCTSIYQGISAKGFRCCADPH